MIELKNVSKTYRMGDETIQALDDVNIKINTGEFVAIMGPSGSGKSTLANVIGGLDVPDTGEVVVDEQSLRQANDDQLSWYRNKHIGFVFQTFNLQPSLTAIENVAIPLLLARVGSHQRFERAKACLNAVGLSDRARHKPAQLSGGQRQRVCVARAIANNPQIIIADEPTGNLDSKKGMEIVQLLKDLNKSGITILVITHDEEVAKRADRVLSIHDGKIHQGSS